MFKTYYEQMMREAIAAYPNEAVWFITRRGCQQVPNISSTPEDTFATSEADTLRAFQDGLLAVVHSHPASPACPSARDMQGQIDSNVPWGIIATDGKDALEPVWWGADTPREDLQTRHFRHGVTDCYALIRDFYLIEMATELPEYPRDWDWWHQEQSLYLEGFASAGFRPVELRVRGSEEFMGLAEPPQRGDMWFAQIRSDVPNHAGVYLGDGLGLHHPSGHAAVDTTRLPKTEPIHRWSSHITHWFRHKDHE